MGHFHHNIKINKIKNPDSKSRSSVVNSEENQREEDEEEEEEFDDFFGDIGRKKLNALPTPENMISQER